MTCIEPEPEYSESELVAMQAENIALRAELKKAEKKVEKAEQDVKNVKQESVKQIAKERETASRFAYVLYCVQRQRIIQRAKVGCGQCDIWSSTHLEDYGY